MAAGKERYRINRSILATEVRAVGEDGSQLGIMPTEEAQKIADDSGLDLVEIAPNADPPVCRVMDYGKFRFEQSKKNQSSRKKQKQIQVKEVKFRPGTDVGDYEVKLRNLKRFLTDGDRAKITLRFRGREMAHQELGLELLQRVERDLDELAVVEQQPKLEGRQMVMVVAPKKR